jgi:hypothetical protein
MAMAAMVTAHRLRTALKKKKTKKLIMNNF